MKESVTDHIDSVVTQEIYQPGDATRYRFIVTLVPHEEPGMEGDLGSLVSVSTGTGGRSMFLWLNGSYLAPSYVREKMAGVNEYLMFVFAHWVNMNYCVDYDKVLKNALGGAQDAINTLPYWLRSSDTIAKELKKFTDNHMPKS